MLIFTVQLLFLGFIQIFDDQILLYTVSSPKDTNKIYFSWMTLD